MSICFRTLFFLEKFNNLSLIPVNLRSVRVLLKRFMDTDQLEELHQETSCQGIFFSLFYFPVTFEFRLTHDSIEDELEKNLIHADQALESIRHMAIDINVQLKMQDPKIDRISNMVNFHPYSPLSSRRALSYGAPCCVYNLRARRIKTRGK